MRVTSEAQRPSVEGGAATVGGYRPRIPQIVLVDQNPSDRAELQKMLSLGRAAVVGEAGYGIDALATIEELRPDVTLVRVEDPPARAFQTIEGIAGALPSMPIIAYSSRGDSDLMRRAMIAGVQDYLRLPVEQEVLGKAVRDVLERSARRLVVNAPATPATELRGSVVTVFGAKGGIGKTTIAASLAVAITRETGESVAIVDIDTRFGDIALMLDLPVDRGFGDLMRDEPAVSREAIAGALVHHASGVSVLSGPRHPSDWERVSTAYLAEVIDQLSRMFDYVILDTPGTFNDFVDVALHSAALIVMVTSTDMSSLKDTALTLDMLRSWDFPLDSVRLVVNHLHASTRLAKRDIERAIGIPVAWTVGFDKAVSRGNQVGRCVALDDPGARASREITAIARGICGVAPRPPRTLRSLLRGR